VAGVATRVSTPTRDATVRMRPDATMALGRRPERALSHVHFHPDLGHPVRGPALAGGAGRSPELLHLPVIGSAEPVPELGNGAAHHVGAAEQAVLVERPAECQRARPGYQSFI